MGNKSSKMDNVEDIFFLTPTQEGVLFHTLEAAVESVYLEQFVINLNGPLNSVALEQAAEELMARHATLRAAILWKDLERPVQVIHKKVKLDWDFHDLTQVQPESRNLAFQDFLSRDRMRGFDLNAAPLSRFTLLQFNEQSWRLVYTFHHILIDGWSTRILLSDLGALYQKYSCGTVGDLKLTPSYRSYVDWLEVQEPDSAEQFWREYLLGLTAPTPFATADHQGVSGAERREQRFELDTSRVDALHNAARELKVTVNTLVQAAWALVVSRYSQEEDVLFGSTLAGRPYNLIDVESMVGLFIETVPTRVKVRPDMPLDQWLLQQQNALMAVAEHAYSGLSSIRCWSQLPPGCDMFESLLVFESMPEALGSPFGELELVSEDYFGRSNFPLAILVLPGEKWEIKAIHDPHRFSDEIVQRALESFDTALGSLAKANGKTTIAELELMGSSEALTLTNWGAGSTNEPVEACWLQLLAGVIDAHPENIAFLMGEVHTSYQELGEEANRRAMTLIAAGLNRGDLVGVAGSRTPDTLISLVAVLLAGGVYVPIDPEQPKARQQKIVKDAGLSWLLGGDNYSDLGLKPFDIEREVEQGDVQSSLPVIASEDSAYVIYTSGSTGVPRGVVVSHGNLLYSTTARRNVYEEPVENFLLLSSLSFDSSVAGIFWTLSEGATLVLPEQGRHDEIEHLLDVAQVSTVSHLLCVPSLYQLLMECAKGRLDKLRVAIVAGEVCPAQIVKTHAQSLATTRLYNEYGPTEATVWATVEELLPESLSSSVSIGVPIPGVNVSVLDAHCQPVPIGVPGELCVSGPTVAMGYLNNQQETQKHFVLNPAASNERMYRTGDIVRWGENGHLEYIGREDGQVKLRGRRIELGEIESTLGESEGVREAAVLLRPVKAAVPRIEELVAELSLLDPLNAESLLDEIEDGSDNHVYHKAGQGFEFNLRLDDGVIAPPQRHQRRWLIRQFLQEMSEDIQQLSVQARQFVSGSSAFLEEVEDVTDLDLSDDEIMEDWQQPILQAMAECVSASHGHVLEIGFGRGVSASMIQNCGVKSHTIVETNEHCIQRYFDPWRATYQERDIRIIHNTWQLASSQLGEFDGVFFHTAARTMEEMAQATIDQVTYAEHFFPTAAKHLNPGGVFTYLANEIDSLSRSHQRLLLTHFSSFRVCRVDQLEIPVETKDLWWAPSMVVVAAVK
jgi:amino acid adenylation domain-containing protein